MLTKEEADDYIQLIKVFTNYPTNVCDLDNILQGDCSSCPYKLGIPCIEIGSNGHCTAASYEMMGLQ